ncbi:PAS domain S-box protein [Lutibacter sp. B2]|nr:PAS domain S-box protein [Lutibacter sp. B2]
MIYIFKKLACPIIALTILIINTILVLNGIKFPDITGIFCIIIIYSVFMNGLKTIYINFIISILYVFTWLFRLSSAPIHAKIYFISGLINDLILIGASLLIVKMIQKIKLSHDELRTNQIRLNKAEHLSNIMILHVGLDGQILKFPPSFCDFIGYSDQELQSANIKDIIFSHDYNATIEKLNIIQQGKAQSIEQEKRYIKKNGEISWVYSSISVVSNEDETPLYLLCYCKDITERKNAEENERLLKEVKEYDELKNEFFANVSHELRTPLNVILGTLQLLNSSFYNNIPKKYTKIMRQNCNRLLRLINNLIDITKIDTGFFEIKLQNVNMVSLIEDITLSVADYIENKGITLLFDTDVEEKIIACDPDKMERIILNLLSNSIKFTDTGGSISVTIYTEEKNIRISVADTGIGIPKEQHEKIFERFKQVTKTLARNHEGSGIGLSLVKSLVELHNGKIYLESEYNVGSNFIIELPVQTLPTEEKNLYNQPEVGCIERIHIEFSDIYS